MRERDMGVRETDYGSERKTMGVRERDYWSERKRPWERESQFNISWMRRTRKTLPLPLK